MADAPLAVASGPTEWHVRLEAPGSLTPEEMLEVQGRLIMVQTGAVGSPGPDRVAVRLTVEADGPVDALAFAQALARWAGFPRHADAIEITAGGR